MYHGLPQGGKIRRASFTMKIVSRPRYSYSFQMSFPGQRLIGDGVGMKIMKLRNPVRVEARA